LSFEQFDEALTRVSSKLLSSRRAFADRCAYVLGQIGEFTGTDLAMLYVMPAADRTHLRTHYRWAREGVPAWDVVPGAPVMKFDHYAAQLREHGLVRHARVAEIPASAEAEWVQVRRRGIESVLMLMVYAGDGVGATLALYALRQPADFSDEQVAFARHAGRMLGHALGRELAEQRRDQAQAELGKLERGVQDAQRLESLGVLAGGIAHDFNNLLAAIMGNAEVALLRAEDETQRTRLERIGTAARRAGELTNQMLAYSGRGRFQLRPLDVNAMIRETSELLRSSIPRSAELALELAEALPAVEGDPPQIQQVVMNLITNAAEALEDGSGRVTLVTDVKRFAEPRTMAGQTIEPGTYVRLRVQDDGQGMDAATVARIFDPFFTTKPTGRGLGLAAVQGIVRGHRGALWVSSKPGEGSTFTVVLPKSDRSPSGTWQATQPRESVPPQRFGGHVLLADDEEHAQQATHAVLEELGFDVLCAADGVEALARFEVDPERYAVVVLDLTMPGMGGAEACARIRTLRPDVPVLLMSGYDSSEIGQLSNEPGIAFVQKPATIRTLSAVFEELLSARPTG
jgi:signal transduction histidine kinase